MQYLIAKSMKSQLLLFIIPFLLVMLSYFANIPMKNRPSQVFVMFFPTFSVSQEPEPPRLLGRTTSPRAATTAEAEGAGAKTEQLGSEWLVTWVRNYDKLVGGLEHFLFFHIFRMIFSTD